MTQPRCAPFRFTEERITLALRQAEAGSPVTDVCRKLKITETAFCRWQRKYDGLGVSELRHLVERYNREWLLERHTS